VGSPVYFVDTNNNLISRNIVAQTQVAGSDINLAVLDSDVPDNVPYYPIASSSDLENTLKNAVPLLALNGPQQVITETLTSVSDAFNRKTTPPNQFGNSFGGYGYLLGHSDLTPTTTIGISAFELPIGGGDSGKPGFFIVGNQPVLAYTHTLSYGGANYSAYIPDINAAIDTLGGGGGYHVTQYDVSCFDKAANISLTPSQSFRVYKYTPNGSAFGTVTSTTTSAGLGSVSYSIYDPLNTTNSAFSVNVSTGVLSVNSTSGLQGLPSPFSLTMYATSTWAYQPLSSSTVNITILTTPPTPSFITPSPTFTVSQGVATSTIVGQVQATTTYAYINSTYSITSGNSSSTFALDSNTGNITVANPSFLNYNTQPSYSLVVKATSMASSTLTATTSVTLNVAAPSTPTITPSSGGGGGGSTVYSSVSSVSPAISTSSLTSVGIYTPQTTSSPTLPTLSLGQTSPQVLMLQKYLNSVGVHVAATGAGSPGNETTYFGSLTRKALSLWQKAQGLYADGALHVVDLLMLKKGGF
jgi:hypothetical protein